MENLVAEATRFLFAQTLSVLESPAPLTPEYFHRPRRKAYLLLDAHWCARSASEGKLNLGGLVAQLLTNSLTLICKTPL